MAGIPASLMYPRRSSSVDQPLAGPVFVHAGLEGSVIALTNVLGEVVEKYRYTAFGLLTVLDAGGNAKATPALSPWLCHGRLYEAPTGLYWMRLRHYSPDFGRFLQPDPAGIAGGLNLYAYVSNNPLKYFDPWGLWEQLLGDHVILIEKQFYNEALREPIPHPDGGEDLLTIKDAVEVYQANAMDWLRKAGHYVSYDIKMDLFESFSQLKTKLASWSFQANRVYVLAHGDRHTKRIRVGYNSIRLKGDWEDLVDVQNALNKYTTRSGQPPDLKSCGLGRLLELRDVIDAVCKDYLATQVELSRKTNEVIRRRQGDTMG